MRAQRRQFTQRAQETPAFHAGHWLIRCDGTREGHSPSLTNPKRRPFQILRSAQMDIGRGENMKRGKHDNSTGSTTKDWIAAYGIETLRSYGSSGAAVHHLRVEPDDRS